MFWVSGDHRDLFSELSALRRQLRSEQKRLESDLQRGNLEEPDSPVNIRSDPIRAAASSAETKGCSLSHLKTETVPSHNCSPLCIAVWESRNLENLAAQTQKSKSQTFVLLTLCMLSLVMHCISLKSF